MKSTVSRTLLALGLAFSVVGAEPRAEANQSAAAPNPAVEAHYNAGVAAAKKATSKQDWEKVCEEFTQAYALEKNPQIAANLGNAELKAGRMRLAAEHLDYFLQQDKEASKEAKNEIENLLEQAKKHIVTVKIDVNQVGAKIVIDNVERGMSPLEGPIYLEENEHTFEVRKAGMKAEKQAHVFKKGDKREIRFEMVADGGGSLAPRKGADKGKEPAWRTGLTVIFSSFAAIGIGTGVITGIVRWNHPGRDGSKEMTETLVELADGTRNDTKTCGNGGYEGNSDECNELMESAQQSENLRKTSIIGFSIGGAALVALLVTRLYPQRDSARTRFKPMLGPSATGLIISRDF